MKFRPLCIDYYLRAQEILAIDCDIRARRASLRSLPNPSPPPKRRRRHWPTDPEDGNRSDRCTAYGDADKNDARSTSCSVLDEGNEILDAEDTCALTVSLQFAIPQIEPRARFSF